MNKILTIALILSAVGFAYGVEREPPTYDEMPTTHSYKLTLRLWTPRIYDNMESLGYRKYQNQRLTGDLEIRYNTVNDDGIGLPPGIFITNLVNKTHKISGVPITYTTSVNNNDDYYSPYDGPVTRVSLIGSNKTDKFLTPSVVFYMDAEPSYNLGMDDEDNSLLCTVAGTGKTKNVNVKTWEKYTYVDCQGIEREGVRKVSLGKRRVIKTLKGQVAGTLGCGCKAYGHKSPTRVAGPYGPTDDVSDIAAVFGTWTAVYYATLVE